MLEPADERQLPYGGWTRARLYFSPSGRGGVVVLDAPDGQEVGFDWDTMDELEWFWIEILQKHLRNDMTKTLNTDSTAFRRVLEGL